MDDDDDICVVDADQPGTSKSSAKSSAAWPSKEAIKEVKASPKKRKKAAPKKVDANKSEKPKDVSSPATKRANDNLLQNCFGYSCLTVSKDLKKSLMDEHGLKNINFSPEVIARTAQIVQTTLETKWAPDLAAFSKHAKRATINGDDVKLLFHKNPTMLKKIEEYAKSETTIGAFERRPSATILSNTDVAEKELPKVKKTGKKKSVKISEDPVASIPDQTVPLQEPTEHERGLSVSSDEKLRKDVAVTECILSKNDAAITNSTLSEMRFSPNVSAVQNVSNPIELSDGENSKESIKSLDSFFNDNVFTPNEDVGLSNDPFVARESDFDEINGVNTVEPKFDDKEDDADEWLSKDSRAKMSSEKGNDSVSEIPIVAISTPKKQSPVPKQQPFPPKKKRISPTTVEMRKENKKIENKKDEEVRSHRSKDSFYDDDDDIIFYETDPEEADESKLKGDSKLKDDAKKESKAAKLADDSKGSYRTTTIGILKQDTALDHTSEIQKKSARSLSFSDQSESKAPAKRSSNTPANSRAPKLANISSGGSSKLSSVEKHERLWNPFAPMQTPTPPLNVVKKKHLADVTKKSQENQLADVEKKSQEKPQKNDKDDDKDSLYDEDDDVLFG